MLLNPMDQMWIFFKVILCSLWHCFMLTPFQWLSMGKNAFWALPSPAISLGAPGRWWTSCPLRYSIWCHSVHGSGNLDMATGTSALVYNITSSSSQSHKFIDLLERCHRLWRSHFWHQCNIGWRREGSGHQSALPSALGAAIFYSHTATQTEHSTHSNKSCQAQTIYLRPRGEFWETPPTVSSLWHYGDTCQMLLCPNITIWLEK